MHLKCIFHDYFFTLLDEGRTVFSRLLVLDKTSLYILIIIIIIIVVRLPSPTLLCMYISRPRLCVFLHCETANFERVALLWIRTKKKSDTLMKKDTIHATKM